MIKMKKEKCTHCGNEIFKHKLSKFYRHTKTRLIYCDLDSGNHRAEPLS